MQSRDPESRPIFQSRNNGVAVVQSQDFAIEKIFFAMSFNALKMYQHLIIYNHHSSVVSNQSSRVHDLHTDRLSFSFSVVHVRSRRCMARANAHLSELVRSGFRNWSTTSKSSAWHMANEVHVCSLTATVSMLPAVGSTPYGLGRRFSHEKIVG